MQFTKYFFGFFFRFTKFTEYLKRAIYFFLVPHQIFKRP